VCHACAGEVGELLVVAGGVALLAVHPGSQEANAEATHHQGTAPIGHESSREAVAFASRCGETTGTMAAVGCIAGVAVDLEIGARQTDIILVVVARHTGAVMWGICVVQGTELRRIGLAASALRVVAGLAVPALERTGQAVQVGRISVLSSLAAQGIAHHHSVADAGIATGRHDVQSSQDASVVPDEQLLED